MNQDTPGVVVLSPPPPRVPIPALQVPSVKGEPVVCQLHDGLHKWGFVAWSEVYSREGDGQPVVDVVYTEDWDAYKYLGVQPPPGFIMTGDARAVWVA